MKKFILHLIDTFNITFQNSCTKREQCCKSFILFLFLWYMISVVELTMKRSYFGEPGVNGMICGGWIEGNGGYRLEHNIIIGKTIMWHNQAGFSFITLKYINANVITRHLLSPLPLCKFKKKKKKMADFWKDK